jgi:hypothetical protein
MLKPVAFCFLLATHVGCGGEKPNNVVLLDAPQEQIDAAESGCTAPAAVPGGMGAIPFTYTPDSLAAMGDPAGNQESWDTFIAANQDQLPDVVLIGFYEGGGDPAYTFADFPVVNAQNPLTIQLNGPESDQTKCSVCIAMFTNVNTANMMELEYADDYQANAGTVTLTELSATKITGTLSGVVMRHVDVDFMAMPPTQVDNASGCTASVGDISFDSVPEMAMMKNGKVAVGLKLPFRNGAARSLAH